MKSWRPQSSPLRFVPVVGAVICLPLFVWLWGLLADRVSATTFDGGVFLLGLALFLDLVLLGTLAYWVWCLFSMTYTLGHSRLAIRCGGVTYSVPLASVTDIVVPGKPIAVRYRGLATALPGYVVGHGRSAQVGPVLSVATVPPARQVLVRTASVAFGLSPQDPAGFAAELQARREEAGGEDTREAQAHAQLPGPAAWGAPLWSDAAARWIMLGGLVLAALFFGYLSLVYGSLPSRLPLHWDAQGQVDRIGDPLELLRLPAYALAIWAANALLACWTARRDKALTLILLIGGAAAQVVFWAAVLSIVQHAA